MNLYVSSTEQIGFVFEYLDENNNLTIDDLNLTNQSISISYPLAASNSIWSGTTDSWTLPVDPKMIKLEAIESILRKIQDYLCVLEDKDIIDFEDKKSLKKAYDKYRMIEDMVRKSKE